MLFLSHYMETLDHYSVSLHGDPRTHIHNLDVLKIIDSREVSTTSLETLALISHFLPPDSDEHMWKNAVFGFRIGGIS